MTTSTLPAGTPVTCTNGHQVCVTAVELRSGQSGPEAGHFTDWQIPAPRSGGLIEPCHCGAPFIWSGLGGGIHTTGGWWPPGR